MEHMLFGKRADPSAEFQQMVDALRCERPALTNLEAFNWVRNTARGKALWEQIGDRSELLAAVTRGEVGKRERVEIRKRDDPNAPTVREIAESKIEQIQKRFVAQGMTERDAWAATARDAEANRLYAQIRSADAHLTVAESAANTCDAVAALKRDIARVRAGQPATLHDAVMALQKREDLDYRRALDQAIADPENAHLLERYLREGR